MMEHIKNLVHSLISGDSVEIENSFNSAMAEKISNALQNMRQEVGQNIFRSQSESEEQEDSEEQEE